MAQQQASAAGTSGEARQGTRYFLVVSHTHREEAITATIATTTALREACAVPVFCTEDRAEFAPHINIKNIPELGKQVRPAQIEAAIVLGGDGTILRAAELLRGTPCPIVGVNLGHVGFLAEMESIDLGETIDRVLSRDYTVEERLTLEVEAVCDGKVLASTWALNEATVEKRRRMLEVEIGVDGRPLSNFACDGVALSSPTGSTAYGFSAGGPIVWPTVQALLMVPIAAHALFNTPLVASPESELYVRIVPENVGPGVMWCDGRRRTELPAGSVVRVRRSRESVQLARLTEAKFSDRLVKKFHLPVRGWRGGQRPGFQEEDD